MILPSPPYCRVDTCNLLACSGECRQCHNRFCIEHGGIQIQSHVCNYVCHDCSRIWSTKAQTLKLLQKIAVKMAINSDDEIDDVINDDTDENANIDNLIYTLVERIFKS